MYEPGELSGGSQGGVSLGWSGVGAMIGTDSPIFLSSLP